MTPAPAQRALEDFGGPILRILASIIKFDDAPYVVFLVFFVVNLKTARYLMSSMRKNCHTYQSYPDHRHRYFGRRIYQQSLLTIFGELATENTSLRRVLWCIAT